MTGPAVLRRGSSADLAHVMPAEDTWVADTWQTGDRIGEIESLAVLPSHRGLGIGTQLLTALERELLAIGVRDLILGVLPGNEAAIRLYQRHGYRSTWTYLSRFAGRSTDPVLLIIIGRAICGEAIISLGVPPRCFRPGL